MGKPRRLTGGARNRGVDVACGPDEPMAEQLPHADEDPMPVEETRLQVAAWNSRGIGDAKDKATLGSGYGKVAWLLAWVRDELPDALFIFEAQDEGWTKP